MKQNQLDIELQSAVVYSVSTVEVTSFVNYNKSTMAYSYTTVCYDPTHSKIHAMRVNNNGIDSINLDGTVTSISLAG